MIREIVLSHETRRNGIVSRQLPYPGLSPPSTFFSFAGNDETRTAQRRKIRGMPVANCNDESVHRRRAVIVTNNMSHRVHQRALTVAADTVAEEHRVLFHRASERVAERAL